MTPPQHIYLNGVLLDGRQETLSAQRLLQDNYVHAAVNTSAHSPLYLEKHLAYAAESYRKLYGTVPQFDTMQLREGIAALLDADRMPRLGNIVRIYLLPSQRSGDAMPDLLAMADHSTIYRGYELISIRPKAILTNYEIPFCGHRTAVSLTTSRYMQAFAERTGCPCSPCTATGPNASYRAANTRFSLPATAPSSPRRQRRFPPAPNAT